MWKREPTLLQLSAPQTHTINDTAAAHLFEPVFEALIVDVVLLPLWQGLSCQSLSEFHGSGWCGAPAMVFYCILISQGSAASAAVYWCYHWLQCGAVRESRLFFAENEYFDDLEYVCV